MSKLAHSHEASMNDIDLISAAAPEMYAALYEAKRLIAGSDDGDRHYVLPLIDAALRRAEGR